MAELLLGVGASLHQWGWHWQSPDLPAPTIAATSGGGELPHSGWLLVALVPDPDPEPGEVAGG
jgi:hypothetical protein